MVNGILTGIGIRVRRFVVSRRVAEIPQGAKPLCSSGSSATIDQARLNLRRNACSGDS